MFQIDLIKGGDMLACIIGVRAYYDVHFIPETSFPK